MTLAVAMPFLVIRLKHNRLLIHMEKLLHFLWFISSAPPIRKYNEKQSQHKTKLRQAKQVFLKVTAQRDRIIQKLENDLVLASSLSHKVTYMAQNAPFTSRHPTRDVCVRKKFCFLFLLSRP